MSIECVVIKTELKVEPCEDETNESENNEIQPELVTVKCEYDPSVTEKSTNEVPSHSEQGHGTTQPSWHQPVTLEPENVPDFAMEIKQEPVDEVEEHSAVNMVVNVSPTMIYQPVATQNSISLECIKLGDSYACPRCHQEFKTKGNTIRHMQYHCKQYKCSDCHEIFLKKSLLEKHMTIHREKKKYECDECCKVFKTSSNLFQHKRSHLVEKPFFCERCHRRFAIKANLIKHQGKSRCKRPIDEPIKCNVCNKIFQKEFLLKSHLRRHTTEKPYLCECCNMNFKYKSTLIRHMLIHNGLKPYACNVCDKTFTHSGLLKPHMRIHTGEKPYECSICKKKFAHKHNMQRHALRHEKIKHLICDVCNKKFPKESRLRYHMRTHSNVKHFACHLCPKKFSHKQNVVRHYTRKHPNDTYDCPDTDASVALKVWNEVLKSKQIKVEDNVSD